MPYTKDFKPEVSRYAVDYPCFLEYSLPDDNCDGKAQWDKDREILSMILMRIEGIRKTRWSIS